MQAIFSDKIEDSEVCEETGHDIQIPTSASVEVVLYIAKRLFCDLV